MLPHYLLLVLGLDVPALAGPEAWPELAHPSGPRDVGADAALVVSIEDYTFAPDIPGANDNARDWYAWLRDARGVSEVRVLQDQDATREAILAAAVEMSGRAKAGGTFWVIFIGHGAPSQRGDDGLLVGMDAQQKALSLEARSVRRQELIDAASAGPQASTLIVLDACFSGHTPAGDLAPGLMPLKPVSERVRGEATVLTAAGSDQYSGPLPGSARPAFSYLLLGALWGWGDANRDGQVTLAEAHDYSRDVLFRTLKDRTQTPSMQTEDPGLVLARGASARGPDLAPWIVVGSHRSVEMPDQASILGGGQDFAALAAEVAARQEAGDLVIRAASARKVLLDQADKSLRGQASRDWQTIAPVVAKGGDAARVLAGRFIAAYDSSAVLVDGERRAVEVAELVQARAALRPPVPPRQPQPTGAEGEAEKALRARAFNNFGKWRSGGKADGALLAEARAGFEGWMARFDGTDHAAVMHYGFAELLYATGEFVLATEHYMTNARLDPAGQYAQFCVESAIFAAENAGKQESGEDYPATVREPIPLSVHELRALDALDLHVELWPAHEKTVAMSYRAAYLLYRHGWYAAAGGRFLALARSRPSASESPQAVNLALDAFVQTQNWVYLESTARQAAAIEGLGDATFRRELQGVVENATMKRIQTSIRPDDPASAAVAYLGFAEEFPASALVDLALNNAASYLRESGEAARATEVQAELRRRFPTSRYAR